MGNIKELKLRLRYMDNRGNWRLTMGKVTPATVWTNSPEAEAMLPPGVGMWVITQSLDQIGAKDLKQVRDMRRESAKQLEDWGVDCIISGGAPISAVDDFESEKNFLHDIRDELSVPYTTGILAQIDAFRALDCESILAVTPYPDDSNQITAEYFERHGIDVVEITGQPVPDAREIPNKSPTSNYEVVRRAVKNCDEPFDCVFIACATSRIVEYIEVIEQDTGCPVVTDLQAQIWKALDFGGVTPKEHPYGELFDTL